MISVEEGHLAMLADLEALFLLLSSERLNTDRMQITFQVCFIFLKHQNSEFIGVDGTCILHATLQRHTVKQLPKPYCKLRPEAKDL